MSFENLRKTRDQSYKDLINKANKSDDSDDRFWTPSVDKSGNGYAIIRFLPDPEHPNELPVCYYDHYFQGDNGKWYVENSRTSLGKTEPDPVSEYNTRLWKTELKENQDIARRQKRRRNYVANIYVIEDPENPDNNGKVFLWRFGLTIFNKIKTALIPKLKIDKPLNPFDMWEGANFLIKMYNNDGGYRSYEDSVFDKPSPFLNTDEEREAIYNKLHKTYEFIDPANYKSYDELKKIFESVVGYNQFNTKQMLNENTEEAIPMPTANPLPMAGDIDDSIPDFSDPTEEEENIFQSLVDSE